MITLYERFQNQNEGIKDGFCMKPEEMADVLLSVCHAIEGGILIQFAPENVGITNEGVATYIPTNAVNIYYSSPEAVVGGKNPDKNSGWFSLGLLMYFMMNGKNYYDDNNISIVQLPDLVGKGAGLINEKKLETNEADVESMLKKAMIKFTSWNPSERSKGFPILRRVVEQYDSSAEIEYVLNGRVVAKTTQVVRFPSSEISAGTVVRGEDGTSYRVVAKKKFAFRPGIHKYSVEVCGEQEIQRCLFIMENITKQKKALMELRQQPDTITIAVACVKGKRIIFGVAEKSSTGGPTTGRAVHCWDIPEELAGGNVRVKINYDPNVGCELSYPNSDGTYSVSRFKV